MSRAEEKAFEAYPVLFSERTGKQSPFPDRREAFQKGYEQAEADVLALLERLRADVEKRDLNIAAQCCYHIALGEVELLIKEGQR